MLYLHMSFEVFEPVLILHNGLIGFFTPNTYAHFWHGGKS